MLRRLGGVGFVVALVGCTDHLVLRDAWDAAISDIAGAIADVRADIRSFDAARDPSYGDVRVDLREDSRESRNIEEAGGSGQVDASCSLENVTRREYTRRFPHLFVLLDRSKNMQRALGTSTCEAATHEALVHAIQANRQMIKFGFVQFPASPFETFTTSCPKNSCCVAKVQFGPTGDLSTAAIEKLIPCGPFSYWVCPKAETDSPSVAALASVKDYYADNPPEDTNVPRYALLVTASEPTCDADNCYTGRKVVSALGDASIRTIILSVGFSPPAESCLAVMSTWKGPSQPPPTEPQPLYKPTTLAELNQQVPALIHAVAKKSCTLALKKTLSDNEQLVVFLDAFDPAKRRDLAMNDPQWGWSFVDYEKTGITLNDKACEAYLADPSSLTVRSGFCSCPGPNACRAKP